MNRRRAILAAALLVAPAVVAGALWWRSYHRRDILVWGNEQARQRVELCRLYSSWGRVGFLSYSRPLEPGESRGGVPFQFHTGDRASTELQAAEVRNQLQQAGVLKTNALGAAYSQHVGSLAGGEHAWTAAVVPWWMVTAAALLLPVSVAVKVLRARNARVSEAAPAAP